MGLASRDPFRVKSDHGVFRVYDQNQFHEERNKFAIVAGPVKADICRAEKYNPTPIQEQPSK